MEIDVEKIQEEIQRLRKQRPKTRFDTYQADLVEYLISKLEGSSVPVSTIMEIAQFAMRQTQIVVFDEVYRAQKEWNRQIRRREKMPRSDKNDVD